AQGFVAGGVGDTQAVDLQRGPGHAPRAHCWLPGSLTSRRASETRMAPSTVSVRPRPGPMIWNGAAARVSRLSESTLPHSAVGGWAPRPRKDRPANETTVVPNRSVDATRTSDAAPGSTWPTAIRTGLAPAIRAAITSGRRPAPRV